MTTPEAAGARTRAEQLVASAEDPDRPVSAQARTALINALADDLAAAQSAETRLERVEAQLKHLEHALLVLVDRVQMR